MIIGTIQNAENYFSIHPLFEKAFAYIRETNLEEAAIGKNEIADGLKVIISQAMGKTKEASLVKFECHNQNIDIQLCIKGTETIGWAPRESCKKPNGGYNSEKDVQLYHDEATTFFQLSDGQFAIFFPEDVHAPMIGEGEIKKMVIKVRI